MGDALPWECLSLEGKRPMTAAGLVVDVRRCVGCHACSVACKTEHEVPLGGFRIRTHYLQRPDRPTHAFFPMTCVQCADAPCVTACPTSAIHRGDDGRVLIDQTTCEGTGVCVDACPYGAIYLDPRRQKADKCDLCPQRTNVGLAPACVEVCPTGALRFGDLADPADPATRSAIAGEAQPLRPEHGTRPTALHVGLEPWMGEKARSVQLHPDDNDIVYER